MSSRTLAAAALPDDYAYYRQQIHDDTTLDLDPETIHQIGLGEMKILELRALAEKELGAKFDLRLFHDAVLDIGSVPLPVLEEHIKQFIAVQKAEAKKA